MIKQCLFFLAQPQITIHPANRLFEVNNDTTNVQFTCMAEGATSYYWEKEDSNIPSNALGKNSNSLLLVNVKLSDSGQYRCAAVNPHGTNFSNYAEITIKGMELLTEVVVCVYVCV